MQLTGWPCVPSEGWLLKTGCKMHAVKKYLDYKSAEEVCEFFFFFFWNSHAKHGVAPKQFPMQIIIIHLGAASWNSVVTISYGCNACSYFPGSIKSNCWGIKSMMAQKLAWHTLACCLQKPSKLHIGKGIIFFSDFSHNVFVVLVTFRGITILKP